MSGEGDEAIRFIGFAHRDFWRTPTIEELRREKRVEPVQDLRELRDEDASDEEVDAFMTAIEGAG